jgi:hypothetical protein
MRKLSNVTVPWALLLRSKGPDTYWIVEKSARKYFNQSSNRTNMVKQTFHTHRPFEYRASALALKMTQI